MVRLLAESPYSDEEISALVLVSHDGGYGKGRSALVYHAILTSPCRPYLHEHGMKLHQVLFCCKSRNNFLSIQILSASVQHRQFHSSRFFRMPSTAAIEPREPNKLVLCFDGTGNTFSGSNADTNVVKILNKLDRHHPKQFHYYQRKDFPIPVVLLLKVYHSRCRNL